MIKKSLNNIFNYIITNWIKKQQTLGRSKKMFSVNRKKLLCINIT